MKTCYLAMKAAACLVLLTLGSRASAAIIHLATPTVYDNAEPLSDYGQTFRAVDTAMSGVQLYIDDPTRPGNSAVNELIGPAELVLYDATSLISPIELHRTTVLQPAVSASGLVTFLFDTSVATNIGSRYFFGVNTNDPYGIGLRSQFNSTYSDGAEAFRDRTTGQLTETVTGRDLSFAVLGSSAAVPEPASLLAWSTFALLSLVVRARAAIGDRVKITRGALAGLLGRIRAFADSHRCVLAIDGYPDGVQVIISGDALEPSSPNLQFVGQASRLT
jgi:hypothetical protein